jgi:chromosome segregation ATPase
LPASNILVADNIPTDTVTQEVTDTRISALEERIEVLQESLQESLKALWEALPGKSEGLTDSPELLKPDEVTDSGLQTELSNLKAENEALRADYAKFLEFSTQVTNKLRQEVQELRSQLETECASREEIEAELSDLKGKLAAALEQNEKLAPIAIGVEFPQPADLLNQLKAKRKKPSASLADVEKILEILGGDDKN